MTVTMVNIVQYRFGMSFMPTIAPILTNRKELRRIAFVQVQGVRFYSNVREQSQGANMSNQSRRMSNYLVRISIIVLFLFSVFTVGSLLCLVLGLDLSLILGKLQSMLLVRSFGFLFGRLLAYEWVGPLILLLAQVSGMGESFSMMMAPSGGEGGSGAGPSGEGTSGTKLPVTANEDSRVSNQLIPQTGEKRSSGSPMEPQIYEGIPVPMDRIEEALSSPFYASSVIHIPGEIEEPLTLYRLSKLNGLLLFLKENVFHEIRADYIRGLQQELDQTPAAALPAKLEEIRLRELARFNIPHR